MVDALADILNSVRMTGAVFSRAVLSAPWGVSSPQTASGIFHAVVHGECWVRTAGSPSPLHLHRGDVVLFPFGEPHILSDTPDGPALPISTLTHSDPHGLAELVVQGGGASTKLLCGTVTFDQVDLHPVLSTLPAVVFVQDASLWLSRTTESLIELMASEVEHEAPGAESMVARLADALVVHVLRSYVDTLAADEGTWFGGLRDDAIREALGRFHRNPEMPWTIERLAAVAGMSRSTFAGKFRTLVGRTPADYVLRWRIHLSANYLREGATVSSCAARVGFLTDAAFSNAFVRVMGVRPGAYRRQLQVVDRPSVEASRIGAGESEILVG